MSSTRSYQELADELTFPRCMALDMKKKHISTIFDLICERLKKDLPVLECVEGQPPTIGARAHGKKNTYTMDCILSDDDIGYGLYNDLFICEIVLEVLQRYGVSINARFHLQCVGGLKYYGCSLVVYDIPVDTSVKKDYPGDIFDRLLTTNKVIECPEVPITDDTNHFDISTPLVTYIKGLYNM